MLCNYMAKKGKNNLSISRYVDKKLIPIGEKFKLTLKIENRKRLPIFFMLLEQKLSKDLMFCDSVSNNISGNENYHISRYTIGKYQRRNRTYTMQSTKRGTYIVRGINVKIGDPLGLCVESCEIDDWLEILICPKVKLIDTLRFNDTSFLGDNTVRRWIHKDPLYIKGIREYCVEDRMKDINWKASLKADKLMVKEYDYTSDNQLVIIINVQCGEPYWNNLNDEAVDKAIDVALALSSKALSESIPTGVWSNANMIYCENRGVLDLMPRRAALEALIEYCTRIHKVPRQEFSSYLEQKVPYFNADTTYVIVSNYLNDKDINVVRQLVKYGHNIKFIDISEDGIQHNVQGVDKIHYKGEVN